MREGLHAAAKPSAMEFWCVEVKYGFPETLVADFDRILHISQACVVETKNDTKRNESAVLSVDVDGKKFVIGTLFTKKLPQQQFKLVFDRDFQLSHNWKNGTVNFFGYYKEESGMSAEVSPLKTGDHMQEVSPLKTGDHMQEVTPIENDDLVSAAVVTPQKTGDHDTATPQKTGAHDTATVKPRDMDCDMWLVIQWGPTLGFHVLGFFIHGGRPAGKQKRGTNRYLKVNKLPSELLEELAKVWPNLAKKSSNKKFWGTQWKNHGVYSGMEPEQYFRTVITLFKMIPKYYDLGLEIDKPIKVSVLRKIMEEKFHGAKIHGIKRNGKLYISELQFLVGKNLSFMDTKSVVSKDVPGSNDINSLDDLVILPGECI